MKLQIGMTDGGVIGLADQARDVVSEDSGETGGRRSLTEPEVWMVEAQLLTLMSEVEPERQWTKVDPE